MCCSPANTGSILAHRSSLSTFSRVQFCAATSHLAKIYQDKNCDRQIGGGAASTQIEQRLLELKALRDKGMLSDAEYEAARKKALGL
jgi:hypothetical protein